jgi:NADH:ubiquinone reductase (H+-translocating)
MTSRIVILGGGFGGAYCAKQLEKVARRNGLLVTLVDMHNNFVFTPLLVEAATSAIEPRHVVVPLRGFLRHSRLVMGEIQKIDLDAKVIEVAPGFNQAVRLEYDHLVIATGSVTRIPDSIPGLAQFAFGLKTTVEAASLRDRAIRMLEMADSCPTSKERNGWLTFVIVGAGYSGVEAAGEFNAFLREAVDSYPNIQAKEIRVIIVQHASRILEMIDEGLSEKATKILTNAGIEIRLSTSVQSMDAFHIVLENGETIETQTTIWTAGVSPPPLLANVNLPKTSRGYIDCSPDLRVRDSDHVWAIGDCASNPDPQGNPYPPTAQHALREGRMAADNIVRSIQGQPTRPLVYKTKGSMASLGGKKAIASVFGMQLSGFLAYFLWRSVYLMLMPGLGRKFRVAMDWTVDLFFQRDCSQLGYHQDQRTNPPSASEKH